MVIDAHLHLRDTGRLRYEWRSSSVGSRRAGRDAVLGGTAARFYGLGAPAEPGGQPGR